MGLLNAAEIKYYSMMHIFYILLTVSLFFMVYFIFFGKEKKNTKLIYIILWSIAFVIFVLRFILNAVNTIGFNWIDNLPLGILSFNLILFPMYVFKNSRHVLGYACNIIFPITIFGLFYFSYTLIGLNFLDWNVIYYFSFNFIMMCLSGLPLLWGEFKPTKKDLYTSIIAVIGFAIIAFLINEFIILVDISKTINYFNTISDGGSSFSKILYSFLPVSLLYLFPYALIIFAFDTLYFLPEIIRKKIYQQRQRKIAMAIGGIVITKKDNYDKNTKKELSNKETKLQEKMEKQNSKMIKENELREQKIREQISKK